jgi:hypothetical protein
MHFMSRCSVEQFKRSSDTWRSKTESAAMLRGEFAELLGEQPATGTAAPEAPDEQGVCFTVTNPQLVVMVQWQSILTATSCRADYDDASVIMGPPVCQC